MGIDFPKNPTTSWVIRTFNEEKWLGKVLETLFMQSRLDFEIIVVDTGSTDKTLTIIEAFPVRKVIPIPRKEFHYVISLNKGIEEAWGKFIGVISGHSLPVSRTWYEDAMKNFDNPKVAGVSGRYYSLPDGSYEEKLYDLHFSLDQLKKMSNYKWMSNTNAIIRKDLWTEYPFDESLEECEDHDWAKEMMARGWDIVYDPAFNVYHSHGGLGRPSVMERFETKWNVIIDKINKRKRPRLQKSKKTPRKKIIQRKSTKT